MRDEEELVALQRSRIEGVENPFSVSDQLHWHRTTWPYSEPRDEWDEENACPRGQTNGGALQYYFWLIAYPHPMERIKRLLVDRDTEGMSTIERALRRTGGWLNVNPILKYGLEDSRTSVEFDIFIREKFREPRKNDDQNE